MERILRRDRALVAATLTALTVLSWIYLVILARDMAQGDMRLMGMGTTGTLGGAMGAVLAQWALSEAALLSPMMVGTSRALTVGLLLACGAYQLSPLKQACLGKCRSPLSFLMTRWRAGDLGAVKMGLSHGAYCLGCCWLLMALLFAGGVMNLFWVAGIAVLVLGEKVLPRGDLIGRLGGIGMLALAAYMMLPDGLLL